MIEFFVGAGLLAAGHLANKKKESFETQTTSTETETETDLKNVCKKLEPQGFWTLSNKTKENDNPKPNDRLVMNLKENLTSQLSGEQIDVEQFIKSDTGQGETYGTWALPNVSKVTQNTEGFENKLAAHTGRDKYTNFKKTELKPFFKPTKINGGFGNVNGQKIYNEKIKERYIPSEKRRNEKPFESIRVGPALGEKFGSEGKGGFHQFERLVNYKNVDQLRVLSNPKNSYNGRVLRGKSIEKPALKAEYTNFFKRKGKSVKNYYGVAAPAGAPEGMENSRKSRMVSGAKRNESVTGRVGNLTATNQSEAGGSAERASTSERFTGKKNNNLEAFNLGGITQPNLANTFVGSMEDDIETFAGPSAKPGKGIPWSRTRMGDYGKSSIEPTCNERDITQTRTHLNNVVSIVKSIIAPLQDKMKRTRKENIQGNPNKEGYIGVNKPKATVYDPNDVARTTIKETTEENNHEGMISGNKKQTVYDPNDVAKTTVKETTEDNNHEGMLTGPKKLTVYDPDDVAKTTVKETTEDNNHEGMISGIKKQTVYDPKDVARTTIKETTEENFHQGSISTFKRGGHQSNKYEANITNRQDTSNKEYFGALNSKDKKGIVTEHVKNADLNDKILVENYQSGGRGYEKRIGTKGVKITTDKDTVELYPEKYKNVNVRGERIPGRKMYGSITKDKTSNGDLSEMYGYNTRYIEMPDNDLVNDNLRNFFNPIKKPTDDPKDLDVGTQKLVNGVTWVVAQRDGGYRDGKNNPKYWKRDRSVERKEIELNEDQQAAVNLLKSGRKEFDNLEDQIENFNDIATSILRDLKK